MKGTMNQFHGRLAVQQRVLPSYRVPFFDLLAESCKGGMSLFAGQPRLVEMIATGETRIARFEAAQNIHLLGGGLYACHQKGIVCWLEEWDPDALVVEASLRNISTRSAIRWMHQRKRKVLGWGLGVPKANGFWRSFINQFDGMLAYSRRGAEEYAALGIPREKIFTAFNSVSPAPSAPPVPKSGKADAPVLLFVGRLQARKRIDSLLRACAEMEPRPRLIIVGDGPKRAALEVLAHEVFPSAEFVGAKHGPEAAPYFAAADLFVLPGTGGLAVQEAMSHGLPVIVAKGDGTQDDLVREGNGWQITPEDYGALVAAMKNALSDTARLRSMGEESFRIVSEEVNIQRMAAVFVDALNAVTSK